TPDCLDLSLHFPSQATRKDLARRNRGALRPRPRALLHESARSPDVPSARVHYRGNLLDAARRGDLLAARFFTRASAARERSRARGWISPSRRHLGDDVHRRVLVDHDLALPAVLRAALGRAGRPVRRFVRPSTARVHGTQAWISWVGKNIFRLALGRS